MRIRLIYPRFRKLLYGHSEVSDLVKNFLVGDYTMPPSLALPIIASLTPPEIEVLLTDDNVGQEIDYDEKVDLVAVSCFTPQAGRAYEILDEFRRRGTRTIVGGLHPSCAPEEALGHADSVCVGEVEGVWDRIIADLRKGELKRTYQAEEYFDLREMRPPKREIFRPNVYKWDAHLVLTTRGCFVNCGGCPVPTKEGTGLRLRPVDDVIEDIRGMPYREFYFTDDTVMLPGKKSRKYILSIMERTRDLDVSIFLASTMMMVDDPEFYHALRDGGASSIYTVFGYDRNSRRLFSRDCPADDWKRSVDLVRTIEDAGIHFFASYGVGFDDQDEGAFDAILQFSEEAGIDLAEFYMPVPFPGTPFGRQCEQEGRVLHRNYDLWNTGNVVYRPLLYTPETLLKKYLTLWRDFFRDKKPEQTLRSFDIVDNPESVATPPDRTA